MSLQILNNKGFTLVELLVVFSIIGILSVIGIASFASSSKQQILNNAYADTMTFINKAKSRTLSQVTQDSLGNPICGLGTFVGYEVKFCNGSICATGINQQYELNVECSNPAKEESIEQKKLPVNVTFNNNTPNYVLFHALTGAVDIYDSNNEKQNNIAVTILGYGDAKKQLCIYNDGRITNSTNGSC